MSEVRSLEAFRKTKKKKAAAGHTLCKNGHHRWKTDNSTQFDSKLGKLVTRYQCERCAKVKVESK